MNEGDLTALLRDHASRHSVPGAAVGILREGAVTTAYYGASSARASGRRSGGFRLPIDVIAQSIYIHPALPEVMQAAFSSVAQQVAQSGSTQDESEEHAHRHQG